MGASLLVWQHNESSCLMLLFTVAAAYYTLEQLLSWLKQSLPVSLLLARLLQQDYN